MDDQTTDGLKDTARMHAHRDEVRAGIPLLVTMLAAGLTAAYTVHPLIPGGIAKWTATIGVFGITAHVTGTIYGIAHSKLRGGGDE